MSAAVSAAAKKLLLILASNKKTLKKAAIGILSILLVLIMPAIAVAGIFSGKISIDTEKLMDSIRSNLTSETAAMLRNVEDTMKEIERTMEEAELRQKAKEAQVLYIMALQEYAGDADFVSTLVGCFSQIQTDASLINRVNAAFGTEIPVTEFTRIANMIRPSAINTSRYTDPLTKNNHDLVEWAIAAERSGWGYVWGTFGHILTPASFESKFNQYPEDIGPYADFIREHWIGGRTADCVGFIKGYCWLDAEAGAIHYGSNGMPDVDTDGLYYLATEKGSIDTLPELPGVVVWQDGHVGIYIGDGEVIEAKGTYYGVVRTKLENGIWSHWLKVPCIFYEENIQGDTQNR